MRKLTFVLILTFVVTLTLQPGVAAASTTCTHYCPQGGQVSCTAWDTCDSGYDWVKCDNNSRIYCPTTTICTVYCPNNPSFGQCTSYQDQCESGRDPELNEDYIKCDNNYIPCPPCPNNQIIC